MKKIVWILILIPSIALAGGFKTIIGLYNSSGSGLPGYSLYQEGTIQAGQMPSAEGSITLFVDLSSLVKAGNDLFNTCQTDGGDIRTTLEDNTEIPRDVMYINKANGAGFLAVKVTNANVGEKIRVWYNGTSTEPAVDSAYGSQNAWDATYDAVYIHKNRSGTTVSDATVNGNSMTIAGSDTLTDLMRYQYDNISNAGPTAHEACYYDGTYYYFSHTNGLFKRSTIDGANVATNADPVGDLNTDKTATCNHMGAMYVYGDHIYIPVENWTDCGTNSEPYIARYLKSDLSYVDAYDISAQSGTNSGICINPSAGDNGTIYCSQYCAEEIDTYDLATPSTFLGTITLDGAGSGSYQGIEWDSVNEEFLLSNSTYIEWYDISGNYLGRRIVSVANHGDQNCFLYGTSLFWWDGTNYKLLEYTELVYNYYLGQLGKPFLIGNGVSTTGANGAVTYTHPDAGSVTYIIKPVQYYDYGSLLANSVSTSQWQAWIPATAICSWRTNSTTSVYDLDDIHAAAPEETYYINLSHTKNGANADQVLSIDGSVRDSDSPTWAAPGATIYINGGNSAYRGKSWYFFVALRNIDIGLDTDRLTTEYNSAATPTSFWVFGDQIGG